MRLNKEASKLKMHDRVTTDYLWGSEDAVRRITRIIPSKAHSSGFMASADAGEACPTCRLYPSKNIGLVDASWFIPVGGETNGNSEPSSAL